MSGRPASGFYGKLPWTGDFVQRRLPQDRLQQWDEHLAALLPALPVPGGLSGECGAWAFLCAPGVCGSAPWAGVVGPGADRVGRRFPLLIACTARADADAGGLLRPPLPWFAAATGLLAAVQAGAVTATDDFDAAVLALPLPDQGRDETSEGDAVADADADPDATAPRWPRAAGLAGSRLAGWRHCLATRGSLWWRDGGAMPCVLAGLPDAEQCLRALGGAYGRELPA